MTESDSPPVKPARRTARRRLLVLGGAGLAVLLAVVGVVNYRHTVPLRPALFVQTPGTLDTIQFTRDGRLLMTTEGDVSKPMVTFRDADTGQVVRQWPGGAGQQWLSADGTRFLETDYALHGPSHSVLRDAVNGRVLRQWTGQIGDVRPDFSLMVTAADAPYRQPQTARVVEVETGRVVGQFDLKGGTLDDARLARSGPFLCVPSAGSFRLLRLPSMTPVLTGLPLMRSLRVTRDGTRAFGLDGKGTLYFWALASGHQTTAATGLLQTFWVSELTNGDLVVNGLQATKPNWKTVVQVRSADGTRLLRSFDASPKAFSPEGRLMAADSKYRSGTCAVWDLETGQRRVLLDVAADSLGNQTFDSGPGVGHLAIAPNGRCFAYGGQNGLLRLYRPGVPAAASALMSQNSGQSVLSFGSGSRYSPSLFDAVVLPDGGVAASGGQGSTDSEWRVQVWHPGQEAWAVKTGDTVSNVARLGVSPDGAQVAGSTQYGIWTLNLTSRISLATPIQNSPGGGQGFTPHGVGQPVWLDGPGQPVTTVLSGDFGDGPADLLHWDAAGQFVNKKTVVPAKQVVGSRTFTLAGAQVSPDGNMLAVLWNEYATQKPGSKSAPPLGTAGKLELRDTRTGRLLKTLTATLPSTSYTGSQGAFGQPAFSPDGKRLAVADDIGGLSVWDTGSGHLLGRLSGTRVNTDSRLVAFAGPSGMTGAVGRPAFTPDNRWLAVSRDDGSLYLYSLRSWLPVAQLGQTPQPLHWLAFAPDGRTLYGFHNKRCGRAFVAGPRAQRPALTAPHQERAYGKTVDPPRVPRRGFCPRRARLRPLPRFRAGCSPHSGAASIHRACRSGGLLFKQRGDAVRGAPPASGGNDAFLRRGA